MGEVGKAMGLLISGTLVYYHCSYRNATILSLFADVLIVLLCSLAILGLLFRQLNVSVPVDPLEWQISQDTASNIVARLANTVGAAEAVLRVAATGHDKRLFVKANARVMHFLLGRDLLILFVSPRTTYIRCNRCVCRNWSCSFIQTLVLRLCMFCLSMLLCQNSQPLGSCVLKLGNGEVLEQDAHSDT
ncbi:hypothetical protein DY000_02062205 [Brassica cretica]|uniref:Reticulon domain-containing protein n=1 Tax=Brassica cretica TaxID=69181 RepID=A0ABQ7AT05_BRACR|nr:hypothetical protein DY000_02062205 [Brassica cretica]